MKNIMMRQHLSNTEDNNNIKGMVMMRQFHNNIEDNKNIKDKDNLEMIFNKDMIQTVISRLFRLYILMLLS